MKTIVDLEIVIFVMPWEVDAYARTVEALGRASRLLDGNVSLSMEAVLGVSDGIVQWQRSDADCGQIIEKFNEINRNIDWAHRLRVIAERAGSTLGCADLRRQALSRAHPGANLVWLDADIEFPACSLQAMALCIRKLGDGYYILTPQIPRLWDDTWDRLVHRCLAEEPIGSCYDFDLSKVHSMTPEAPEKIRARRIPGFKFAGGYCTVLSSGLVSELELPESFAPYGEEDTFVMRVCESLEARGRSVSQYLMDGLLVAPDFSIGKAAEIPGRFDLVQDRVENVRLNRQRTRFEVRREVSRILSLTTAPDFRQGGS